MSHTLKNKNLEIQLDNPYENYQGSRFDWSGKIAQVTYKDIALSVPERPGHQNDDRFGKGFYNEFGIDTALGFDQAKEGEWFHKIGVGLLRKEGSQYRFDKDYQIRPAGFKIIPLRHKILMSCRSEAVNGYAYELEKEIQIKDDGFSISYYLKNTGEKEIITDEYTHNFMAIDKQETGPDYHLKFPFEINPELFEENVNPEAKVDFVANQIGFKSTPIEPFFFSNLSGQQYAKASWELINQKIKVGIREIGSFETDKVNVWGWNHVISPELFMKIALKPGQAVRWYRNYQVFEIQ